MANDNQLYQDTISLSVPVARDMNITDAVLYQYLQNEQAQINAYVRKHPGDNTTLRDGKHWIPRLGSGVILEDLPCLKSTTVILNSADRLMDAGKILIEKTGKYFLEGLGTNRKAHQIQTTTFGGNIDAVEICSASKENKANQGKRYSNSLSASAWYHVPITSNRDAQLTFSQAEAVALDSIPKAIIRQYLRWLPDANTKLDDIKRMHKRLSAKELELVLPFTEKTIRRHLNDMVNKREIIRHPRHPKYYRIDGEMGIPASSDTAISESEVKIVKSPTKESRRAFAEQIKRLTQKNADEAKSPSRT